MSREDDLARAIRQRDVESIVRLMFEADTPELRSGFRTETELWDFKRECPTPGKGSMNAWADLAADILGFHNNKGGVIVFGIEDKTFSCCGARNRLDSKLLNDQIRRFLGDKIWVQFHREFIQADQRYIGIALIPGRGPTLERFRGDAPEADGKRLFKAGYSAIRKGDSTYIFDHAQANEYSRKIAVPTLGRMYSVEEPFFRILAPEYIHFVERSEPCRKVESALQNPRAAIASIIGIGGVGKTALATWAAIRAFENKDFDFIVSITAKDRELTSSGIQALEAHLTSFESLLDNILEVLGFLEIKNEDISEKEKEVRSLLHDSNGLLYVDNLETVDDPRIVSFLDDLPLGVRALTTSRRTTVRVSVHPIDLGPLSEDEIIKFLKSLESYPSFRFVSDFSDSERARIGTACNGIPLAIRWTLSRCGSVGEALAYADTFKSIKKHSEELLEFCFRRIFDSMTGPEQSVLQVLSLFQSPVPTEALVVGTELPPFKIGDAVELLVSDALVQRLFDSDRNDYCYTLLPITRSFVYGQVKREPQLEVKIRRRLSDWFEAKDVKDLEERVVIREIRQGRKATELSLLDLAQGADRRGDLMAAQDLYEQALKRNPRSWRAARLYGEFQRHKLQNEAEALRLYEQAAAHAPQRGPDRALIFREWGMLLRDSGIPDATDLAIDKFQTALMEEPNDVITIHALAHMFERKGYHKRVIELLAPLENHPNRTTRKKSLPLLLRAYESMNDIVGAARIRQKLEDNENG